MAEIKIEKKKPVWPWILLILVIIAAALYYFWHEGQENDENHTTTLESTNTSAVLPVHDAANFIVYNV